MKQVAAFLISAVLLLFCNLSFAIEGDITGDSTVDFNDLALIAQNWTQSFAPEDTNSADITGDGSVNFDDYAIVAKNWMACEYTGLIGWWKLNDAAGVIATNSSPYNNNATLIGNPQWRNDPNQSWCLEFDGYGDYLSVTNEPPFDITEHITISAWIKTIAGSDDAFFAVTKGDSYVLYKNMGANYVTFLCEGLGRPVNGTININDGKWHHIVGVYDGTAKYIYVDGQLDATKSSSGSIITNDLNVRIGSHELITDSQCNGKINDVRIFSQALSLAEINSLPDEKLKQAAAAWPGDNAPWAAHDVRLRWTVANGADSQGLFVGTDYQQVTDANDSSSEFKGNLPADVNSYFEGPQTYDANTTYYWRVDQIFDGNTVKGKTWGFTAGDSYIFDFPAGSLDEVEKVAAYCLQGLCNKVGAKVLMNSHEDITTYPESDTKWTEYLSTSKGYVFHTIVGLRNFIEFAKNQGHIKGLVVYDIDNIEKLEMFIAENYCALEELLPVTGEMLNYQTKDFIANANDVNCFANLPIVEDLRSRWATKLDAQSWYVNNMMGNFPKYAAFKDGGAYERWVSTDLAISQQLFIYDMNPDSNVPAEVTLYDKVMNYLTPPACLFGCWHDEGGDVARSSDAGHYNIVTAGSANCSFWARAEADPCNMWMRQQTSGLVFDPNNYYVMFQGSDGDAMRVLTSFMGAGWGSYWAAPWINNYSWHRGQVPYSWSTQPVAAKFFPCILEYYAQTASPMDHFFAGPSGAGYCSITTLPNLAQFAQFNQKMFKLIGVQMAEFWGGYSPESMEIFSQNCPAVKCITNKPQNSSDNGKFGWLSTGIAFTQTDKLFWEFPIGSSMKIAILDMISRREPPFFMSVYCGSSQGLYNAWYCDKYLQQDNIVYVGAQDFIDLMNQAYIYFNSK